LAAQPSLARSRNIFADSIEVAFPELFIEVVVFELFIEVVMEIFVAKLILECVPTAIQKMSKP
jgi:hypothetical protein